MKQIKDFILRQNAETSEKLNKDIGYAAEADMCANCAHYDAKGKDGLCQKKKELGHIDIGTTPMAHCGFYAAKKFLENSK